MPTIAFLVLLCLLLLAGSPPLRAGEAEGQAMVNAIAAALRAHDWPAVERLCRQGMAADAAAPELPYLLARALARQGRKPDAIAALETAVGRGFCDDTHGMRADEDLAILREDPAFPPLCARVHALALAAPYERGGEIAGVATHEDWPSGGLRYRLRLPAGATTQAPARLVVWLHPAGASGNALAETLAGDLARRNWGLVVFTRKDFRGWDAEDGRRIVEVVLPALAAVPGVDARRPLLLGYSAGGQLALLLWRDHPERFGGLMLSAAYPVEAKPGFPPLALPSDATALKGSRIFALVGARDAGGVRAWRRIEADWRAAGIGLAWHVVDGRGHEYLFPGTSPDDLFSWIDALPALR